MRGELHLSAIWMGNSVKQRKNVSSEKYRTSFRTVFFLIPQC